LGSDQTKILATCGVGGISGDTKVLTRNGVLEIGAIAGQVHQLLSSTGEWVTALITPAGEHPIIELLLSRSRVTKRVRATKNCRWLVRSWGRRVPVTTRCLAAKDNLLASFRRPPVELSPDAEGIARGFVFGDGTIAHKKSVAYFFGAKDAAVMKFFEGRGRIYRYGNMRRLGGLPLEWKTERPSIDSSAEFLYGWLAGYFAADGDVGQTGRPTLSSARRENLEYVREIGRVIGIGTFGVRERFRSGFGRAPSALYLMGLMRGDLTDSFFLIPDHKSRFLAGRNAAERRGWNVISITSVGHSLPVYATDPPTPFALEDNLLVEIA